MSTIQYYFLNTITYKTILNTITHKTILDKKKHIKAYNRYYSAIGTSLRVAPNHFSI